MYKIGELEGDVLLKALANMSDIFKSKHGETLSFSTLIEVAVKNEVMFDDESNVIIITKYEETDL